MFNALKYVKILEECGFTTEQATATIKILVEVMNDEFATNNNLKMAELAIRSDMNKMETSIRSDMNKMETSIRAEIRELEVRIQAELKDIRHSITLLENRLTIKLSGIMVAAIAILKYI
jgi:hypothetical protein